VGYTGVVWESRSTEQLARDLTDGAGPSSLGDAGAAWVRISNAFQAAAAEYTQLVDRIRLSWQSEHSPAVQARLLELGAWLEAKALNAAANGQRAEEAAVAATVAIMAMPTVTEAAEARARHDMMASLEAYNGAVLAGSFAEFDAAATADQANAAAVMRQYEDAVAPLATPWEEAPPPQVAKGDAAASERVAADTGAGMDAGTGGGVAAPPPVPLSPWTARPVEGSERPGPARVTAVTSAAASGIGGAPFAPMAGMARSHDDGREYESTRPPALLEGGGEAAAGLSAQNSSWLPTAQVNDGPFLVETVSWGPDTSALDGLADPPFPDDDATPALEQVSDHWVAPAVIGGSTEEP
jgi:hypothetical protein